MLFRSSVPQSRVAAACPGRWHARVVYCSEAAAGMLPSDVLRQEDKDFHCQPEDVGHQQPHRHCPEASSVDQTVALLLLAPLHQSSGRTRTASSTSTQSLCPPRRRGVHRSVSKPSQQSNHSTPPSPAESAANPVSLASAPNTRDGGKKSLPDLRDQLR